MIYIDSNPNPSGAYPAGKNQPFPGCIPLTDDQAAIFKQYNGFVILSEGDDGETIVTPNTEAWEAWKAEQEAQPEPEPTPTMDERVSALEAKNEALITSNQFLEDCLVEMAGIIYA